MKEKLQVTMLDVEGVNNCHTVGGLVLFVLGHIPKKSECFICSGWKFEVVDVDGNRVDQVLATKVSD